MLEIPKFSLGIATCLILLSFLAQEGSRSRFLPHPHSLVSLIQTNTIFHMLQPFSLGHGEPQSIKLIGDVFLKSLSKSTFQNEIFL